MILTKAFVLFLRNKKETRCDTSAIEKWCMGNNWTINKKFFRQTNISMEMGFFDIEKGYNLINDYIIQLLLF